MKGDFQGAQGLLAWLAGQPHIDRLHHRSRWREKGPWTGRQRSTFLRGVLMVLRQAGHPGLVVVLDEVEDPSSACPRPREEKSLNALRQLVDMLANNELPGLGISSSPVRWRFFDELSKGLKGLTAATSGLRRASMLDPAFDNLHAPPRFACQVFDEGRSARGWPTRP